MKKRNSRENKLKRMYQQSLRFNMREMRAIDRYCTRYKVSNKSKFMREAIIKEVLKKWEEDHPSLFDEMPNLFSKNLPEKPKNN